MIEKANFTLFSYFSDDLKDFIKKILRKKPQDRMTLEEALQHPFITKYV